MENKKLWLYFFDSGDAQRAVNLIEAERLNKKFIKFWLNFHGSAVAKNAMKGCRRATPAEVAELTAAAERRGAPVLFA